MKLRALLGAVLALWTLAAAAHRSSDAFLDLQVDAGAVRGQWEIAVRDLAVVHPIDADADGAVTWGELRRGAPGLFTDLEGALSVTSDGERCPVSIEEVMINQHVDGPFAWFALSATCPHPPQSLGIDYRLLSGIDPSHRGIVVLRFAGGPAHSAILGGTQPAGTFSASSSSVARMLGNYVREGVHHIWIGADHILFLLCLLLPSVLRREPGRWTPLASSAAAIVPVVGVVTAFTVAHSVTLGLAALEVLRLPTGLVESGIAASVVVAAMNNVVPLVTGYRWAVALAFGLVHGFGFASVLGELGLPPDMRLMALLGFNVGVELGQLAIVLAVLPLILAARRYRLYGALVLPASSMAIAAVACLWLIQRWPG